MHNDIWSLGIILLNLTTGCSPWNSATLDDATYKAYLTDPNNFLTSALPISDELNDVMVRILKTNWTAWMLLVDFHDAVESIGTFYASNIVFEGSLALYPWETGVELGNEL